MINKVYYGIRYDGVELYQRSSDQNVKIRQLETGKAYDDPIDIEPCPYTYEETDIPIEPVPDELTIEDTLGMLNELGVNTDDK